jgi:hypothetical protein
MQAEDRRKQSNSPRDTATARHVRPKDKGELLTKTNIIKAVKQPPYEGGWGVNYGKLYHLSSF